MTARAGTEEHAGVAGEPERPRLAGEGAQRYELGRCVGRGGMGVVWAARERGGREVAIKVLRLERPAASVARLRREAAAMRRADHPSVCVVEDLVDLEDGSVGLVMELLDGETLQARLDREGKLEPATAARLLVPVLEAVRAAHLNGVVHRDLKPSNVFLLAGGGVRVLDFGIAKILTTGGAAEGDELTTSNTLLGSPAYMAPEQIFGEPDLDARADVWALGLVLYRTLSGVLPTDPQGEGVGKVLKLILKEPIRPLREVAPEVPAELARAVDGMLAREREHRSPDLAVALVALRACDPEAPSPPSEEVALGSSAPETPGAVVDAEVLAPAPPPPARRAAWLVLATAVAALALGLVVARGPRASPGAGDRAQLDRDADPAPAHQLSPGPVPRGTDEGSSPVEPAAASPAPPAEPPSPSGPPRATPPARSARTAPQSPRSPARPTTAAPDEAPPAVARDPLEDAR